uniref:Uncharacterized protein n=1 Tax=Arundo donax TaxID=35708 RepID=A0A0A9H417_ARUDO
MSPDMRSMLVASCMHASLLIELCSLTNY